MGDFCYERKAGQELFIVMPTLSVGSIQSVLAPDGLFCINVERVHEPLPVGLGLHAVDDDHNLLLLLLCAALLTVSEEVRSRCSLKHRKSLLISDLSMDPVPMDTYSSHITDPSCR